MYKGTPNIAPVSAATDPSAALAGEVCLEGQRQVQVAPQQVAVQDAPHWAHSQLVARAERAARLRVQTCGRGGVNFNFI